MATAKSNSRHAEVERAREHSDFLLAATREAQDLCAHYIERMQAAEAEVERLKAQAGTLRDAMASPAAGVAPSEPMAWLIEFRLTDGSVILWWDGTFKRSADEWLSRPTIHAHMVNDANKAVRFAARESAQTVLDSLLAMRPMCVFGNAPELYSVTEHMWPAPAAARAEPAGDDRVADLATPSGGREAGPEEDRIEAAYWRFDARRKGYGQWKHAPMSERDAFKAEMRNALGAEKVRAEMRLAANGWRAESAGGRDERADFEAWARGPHGFYRHSEHEAQWQGWQARAALATHPSQQPQEKP